MSTYSNLILGVHRLQIMELNHHSSQPYILELEDKTTIFICKGEVFKFKDLITKEELDITTHSDCLTIPKLYIKHYNSYETILKTIFM